MGEGTGEIDDGHTAWILMSCALVNFMTPGLAFFYGGLVRRNHTLLVAQRPSSFRRQTPAAGPSSSRTTCVAASSIALTPSPRRRLDAWSAQVHGHSLRSSGSSGASRLLRRVGPFYWRPEQLRHAQRRRRQPAQVRGARQGARGLRRRHPGLVFAAYQGMFAVITPALMTGAFAERIKFGPF